MRNYPEIMVRRIAEQFKDKQKIRDLMEVIGEEFQEVYEFLEQLRTQRNLDNAVGVQLDRAGDIAVMTRMEAGQLSGNPIPIEVIDDETYRKYLIYKILKNNCDCTYPDIINAFRMFWDKPLYYREDPEHPATMIFDTGDLPGGSDTSPLFTTPLIRPAGVSLELVARTREEMPKVTLNLLCGLGFAVTITQIPALEREIDFGAKVYAGSSVQSVMQTPIGGVEKQSEGGI